MASGDQDTAVFDIAYECLSEFDKVYDSHGGDLTTRLFEMDDLSGGYSSESNCHIVRKCDFMGLRNSFIFWADYTGALSLMESSLDARLQGFPDISSMFVELLEMISRNLSRRKQQISFPSFRFQNIYCQYLLFPLPQSKTRAMFRQAMAHHQTPAGFGRMLYEPLIMLWTGCTFWEQRFGKPLQD